MRTTAGGLPMGADALVVGSELAFEARGEHELKGVPGTWSLHAVC